MSELGTNQGQNEDKNDPVFDSSKLSGKQNTEHFTNIKGAEARAKAEEKAKIDAKKAADAAHQKDVRNAVKENTTKKGAIYFLFAGWHKIVTIIAILLILAGVGFLIFNSIQGSESAIAERDSAAMLRAQEVYVEAENVRLAGSYDDAKQKFEDALKKCNREEKIFITAKYAEYVASMEYDSDAAYAMLDNVKSETKNETEEQYISVAYSNVKVYTGVDNE